ncbi:MAG: CPBP family intramembrane glutamic endopeptidase [Pseudomonadota bacterium]
MAVHEEFSRVSVPVLLLIILGAVVFTVLTVSVIWPEWLDSNLLPVPEAVASVSLFAVLWFAMWLAARRNGVRFSEGLRFDLSRREAADLVLMGVPMVASAVLAVYVFYLPLSYIWPAFVSEWLLEDWTPIIWYRTETVYVVCSIVNVIAAVILAPVVEEFFFRGLLFSRFLKRFGLIAAMIVPSLLFGVLHADVLGAFFFGVILSFLFLRTGSLVGPIIIHMSNNALAVLTEFADSWYYGRNSEMTLAEFQAYWWLAPIAAVICIPWIIWFWRRWLVPRAGAEVAAQPTE